MSSAQATLLSSSIANTLSPIHHTHARVGRAIMLVAPLGESEVAALRAQVQLD
jgi:hypothetical protein